MISESTPKRRRHYRWWIAGGVCAAFFGLIFYIWVNFGETILHVYDIATGNPFFPGCERTAMREAEAGSLWYRMIEMRCPNNGSISLLYVKRQQDSFPVPQIAYFSMNGPAAVSVRETDSTARRAERT
jgi:hypothetical protein